jgi:outer membrane lipoprotein carrier protein
MKSPGSCRLFAELLLRAKQSNPGGMTIQTIGAVVTGLFFVTTAFAATPLSTGDAAAVQKKFRETQQATKTFRAEFTSELKLEKLNRIVSSKGVLYFQAPDRVRMEYAQPAGEWVVLSGRQLAVKKSNRSVQVFDLKERPRAQQAIQSLLAIVGRGTESWDTTHAVEMFAENGKTRVLLVPKSREDARQPEKIEVLLRADLSLEQIQVRFPGDNGMLYRLGVPVRNQPVDAGLFVIPEEKETALDKLKRK